MLFCLLCPESWAKTCLHLNTIFTLSSNWLNEWWLKCLPRCDPNDWQKMKGFRCLASTRVCIEGHTTVNRAEQENKQCGEHVAAAWLGQSGSSASSRPSCRRTCQCWLQLRPDGHHSHGSFSPLAGTTGWLSASNAAQCILTLFPLSSSFLIHFLSRYVWRPKDICAIYSSSYPFSYSGHLLELYTINSGGKAIFWRIRRLVWSFSWQTAQKSLADLQRSLLGFWLLLMLICSEGDVPFWHHRGQQDLTRTVAKEGSSEFFFFLQERRLFAYARIFLLEAAAAVDGRPKSSANRRSEEGNYQRRHKQFPSHPLSYVSLQSFLSRPPIWFNRSKCHRALQIGISSLMGLRGNVIQMLATKTQRKCCWLLVLPGVF